MNRSNQQTEAAEVVAVVVVAAVAEAAAAAGCYYLTDSWSAWMNHAHWCDATDLRNKIHRSYADCCCCNVTHDEQARHRPMIQLCGDESQAPGVNQVCVESPTSPNTWKLIDLNSIRMDDDAVESRLHY